MSLLIRSRSFLTLKIPPHKVGTRRMTAKVMRVCVHTPHMCAHKNCIAMNSSSPGTDNILNYAVMIEKLLLWEESPLVQHSRLCCDEHPRKVPSLGGEPLSLGLFVCLVWFFTFTSPSHPALTSLNSSELLLAFSS